MSSRSPDCGLVHYARSADHTPRGHHRAAKEAAGSSASGRRRSSQQEANLEPSLRNQPESALQRQWEGNRKRWVPNGGVGRQSRMGRGLNAGESLPGKSTGHTALPGHEARAWECGSEAGGAAVTVRGEARATPAQVLDLSGWPAAQPSGVGEGGLGLGDNKRLAELLPTRVSRFSPALLNQHSCGPPSRGHGNCHWPCSSHHLS